MADLLASMCRVVKSRMIPVCTDTIICRSKPINGDICDTRWDWQLWEFAILKDSLPIPWVYVRFGDGTFWDFSQITFFHHFSMPLNYFTSLFSSNYLPLKSIRLGSIHIFLPRNLVTTADPRVFRSGQWRRRDVGRLWRFFFWKPRKGCDVT